MEPVGLLYMDKACVNSRAFFIAISKVVTDKQTNKQTVLQISKVHAKKGVLHCGKTDSKTETVL
jgi:hypothetical protein